VNRVKFQVIFFCPNLFRHTCTINCLLSVCHIWMWSV